MTEKNNSTKDFYISDLSAIDDQSFILGIIDAAGQERLFTIELFLREDGVVSLRIEKKS